MRKILLDTNAYVAFKKDVLSAVNIIRESEYIAINTIVLGELYSGFKSGSKEARNRKEMDQFLDSPRVHVLDIDEETSEFYAKVFSDLKKKGKPIPVNDIWVAASAMRYGLALFSYDEHFRHIDSLILKKEA